MHSLSCCSTRAHPQIEAGVDHDQHPISFRTIAKAVGVAALAGFATAIYRESSKAVNLSNTPILTSTHKLPLRREILLGGPSAAEFMASCLTRPVYLSFYPSSEGQSMEFYNMVYELNVKEFSSRVKKLTETLDSIPPSIFPTTALNNLYKELECLTFLNRNVNKLSYTADLTLDDLWSKLGELYLKEGVYELVEQILTFRAQHFLSTVGLLKAALEKLIPTYLDLNAPEKALHLMDQLNSFPYEYGEDVVKDDSIREIAKYYLIRGNVDESIQTIARLGFAYERACYMGQFLVPLALKTGDIASARKIADAIPLTPAYGNINHEILEDIPESQQQDLARELIQQVESSNEKKLSENDFQFVTAIRWF